MLNQDLSILSDDTKNYLEKTITSVIAGNYIDVNESKVIDVLHPPTGESIAKVSYADKADAKDAIMAARIAFDDGPWSSVKSNERELFLWRLASLIERDASIIAELESVDTGKPLAESYNIDVGFAVELLRYTAGLATKIEGKAAVLPMSLDVSREYIGMTIKEPIGVVVAIVPWNFPLLSTIFKIAPALAAGCTCIVKPAEDTPLTTSYFGKLVEEAGFPPGVVNIVYGAGNEVGEILVNSSAVDKISFTGSTATGRRIGELSSQNIIASTLELGGKSSAILTKNCNLEYSLDVIMQTAFAHAGQVCTAITRLLVDREIYEIVIENMITNTENLIIGSGLNPSVQMGPLISETQQNTVLGFIKRAKEQGARLLTGGSQIGCQGFFVEPTIFTDVNSEMEITKEEVFGPVLTIEPFNDLEEAIQSANDVRYGLSASIWSSNSEELWHAAKKLKAGMVGLNSHAMLDPASPTGGVKQSGYGRELGSEVLNYFTYSKSIIW